MGEQQRSTKHRGKAPRFTIRERKAMANSAVNGIPLRKSTPKVVDVRFNPIERQVRRPFFGQFASKKAGPSELVNTK